MDHWLTTWGNLGTIVGIFVSFLGFTVAVWQIRRTTGAVESARTAVETTTDSFLRNQVLVNVVRALERVQEVRMLYSEEQWQRALYRYQDVWIMLTHINTQHPQLTSQEKSEIEKLVDQLQRNERVLDKAVRLDKAPPKIQHHVEVLQRVQSMLGSLSGSLH